MSSSSSWAMVSSLQATQREQLLKLVSRLVTNTKWDAEKQRFAAPSTTGLTAVNTAVDAHLLRRVRLSIKVRQTVVDVT
jgi:hypothetical protein